MQSKDSFPMESEETLRNISNDDIGKHMSSIWAEEASKIPYVGDKEPFSSGSPIFLEKIKVLSDQYAFIRRTSRDGNSFFRGFIFAYLEHILDSKDRAEVDRVKANIEQYKEALVNLGDTESGLIDLFRTVLDSLLPGSADSIKSRDELVERSREAVISYYAVWFVRFVTSAEIRNRWDLFKSFVEDRDSLTADEFCKSSVEPMGKEIDDSHIITALSDALGVQIRVVYLDDKGHAMPNHRDFPPSSCVKPLVTILCWHGHYDILYPR